MASATGGLRRPQLIKVRANAMALSEYKVTALARKCVSILVDGQRWIVAATAVARLASAARASTGAKTCLAYKQPQNGSGWASAPS
mmetsp:Transcript_38417/g.120410  ORF Transcript_38417/g.120410 Transcript_38417/m.120410 type:complete len:86 (+) Transcript_38417:412-669(+)